MSTVHQQPSTDPELDRLYADFESEHLNPLWTQLGDLMPMQPTPRAVPHVWRWNDPVPAGRSGPATWCRSAAAASAARSRWPTRACADRRTPRRRCGRRSSTWGRRRPRPEHRHTQNAFRFVVEGEGVWTVVNGDPVAMRRGDFLLHPGLELPRPPQRHRPADGLDRRARHPVRALHRHRVLRVRPRTGHRRGAPRTSPAPSGCGPTPACARCPACDAHRRLPAAAYRWEHTDRALRDQLRARGRGPPGHRRARATPRSATPTRPPAAT